MQAAVHLLRKIPKSLPTASIIAAPTRRAGVNPTCRHISSRPSQPHLPSIRPRIAERNGPFKFNAQSRKRSTLQSAKDLWKLYPVSVTVAAVGITFTFGVWFYANYLYQTYIIGAFHKYPEPVAKKLRRALFYTNIQFEPQNAIKYYVQALEVANELGVDPFTEEITGVRIQIAALLEKVQQYDKTIEVIEVLRSDLMRWMDERGDQHFQDGQRTQILSKLVALNVKLGDLYANEYVQDPERAEERLVWAVETMLKEQRRRDHDGEKEGEGPWMSAEQNGAAMESLAHNYEAKGQHYLATPLFLQALTLSPPRSCHSVILMNNLATSLAQQRPLPSPGSSQPVPTVEQLRKQAHKWATKAITLAATIQPPERNEECDAGCAAATHNLGEFAEMDRNFQEARKRYNEARGLAAAVGFSEGVMNADAALKRLKQDETISNPA